MTTRDGTKMSDRDLAMEALDAACASIQAAFGVTDGMLASLVFSGEAANEVLGPLEKYAAMQRAEAKGDER